jgi:hypothetical protein
VRIEGKREIVVAVEWPVVVVHLLAGVVGIVRVDVDFAQVFVVVLFCPTVKGVAFITGRIRNQ